MSIEEMAYLADFPYDIRSLFAGAPIECLRREGTFGLNYKNELVPPASKMGAWLPTALDIHCYEIPGDYASNNLEKVVELAIDGLQRLPELGHKFVLTYKEGIQIFDCCFLVTTRHSDWWPKYPLLHAGNRDES